MRKAPDNTKAEWVNQYNAFDKKIRTANYDISRLLSFCKTTTLKNDVMMMHQEAENSNINILYDDDGKKKVLLSLREEVRTFKKDLMSDVRDEEYYLRAENNADRIEKKINGIKYEGMEEYGQMAEEADMLEGDIKKLEDNIQVYEEKVQVRDEELPKNPGGGPARNHTLGENGLHRETGGDQLNKVEIIEELFRQRSQMGNDYRVLIERMNDMKTEINDLNNAIESNGGINCGWTSSKDHTEYCKVRLRHQGRTESYPFYTECQIVLPLYPPEVLREHTDAYNKFLKLESKRKEILTNYKLAKEQKRKLEGMHRAEVLAIQENEKKEDPEKIRLEQARKKEMIEKWKREKVTQTLINEDKMEEEIKKKMMINEDKKKKELEEKKKMVQEFREKKEIEKMKEVQRVQLEGAYNTKHVSTEQKMRLFEKEQQLIEKKRQHVLEKRQEEEQKMLKKEQEMMEKHRKMEKVKSKLLDETKALKDKMRDKFDPSVDQKKYADNMAGAVIRTTGRALVSWMNNK